MSPSNEPLPEPIAIVGSSCRFAGGANSPSKLWDLLQNPPDLSRKVPPGRFNVDAFYHPNGEHHGTTDAPRGYFLDQDHRVFDATFFNITPKEAEAIDPQQRMLLEVVYESLQSAGYGLKTYAGRKVAVFVGVMTADYDTLSQRDDLTASQYSATGNARSIVSNRISYFFDFHGPSMTIDTACSSSLVALHQAVLSLRSGESTMACVAGANLMMTPEQFIVESNLHMLSPSGHCRMWDANADGYARGEGIAVVLLKPLSRALADGDRIEAIIRETGVNSDGRTRGITMPNSKAQASLILDTYRRAGLDPRRREDRCQYFEAHGTGTQTGDPREAAAIDEAFFGSPAADAINSGRDSLEPVARFPSGANDPDIPLPSEHDERKRPSGETNKAMVTSETLHEHKNHLLVGSIKTVVGHTEGAAGLAGVLKVVQSMRHGLVPPNLHLERMNPSVQQFCTNLRIPTGHLSPWPDPPAGHPRRASVNSFGFGGTNAHAIVEQYVPSIHSNGATAATPALLLAHLGSGNGNSATQERPTANILPLFLSASSQKSLLAVIEAYHKHLVENESTPINALAWHTYAHCTSLPYRIAVSGTTKEELKGKLKAFIDKAQKSSLPLPVGVRTRTCDGCPGILGIFTGQGAQWPTIGRNLFRTNSIYRNTIRLLDDILHRCPDPPAWSLESELEAEEGSSRIDLAALAQPTCTALQIALVDLLRSLGVRFRAVVGHSSGEIAAAYAAGIISARDAILISYYRGMFAHLASGPGGAKGGMLAVGLTKEQAEGLCAREALRGIVSVAASNAPASVTLSGNYDAILQIRDDLEKQGKFARLLRVDTAYHSLHMRAPAAEYLRALESSNLSPTQDSNGTLWISSVYGSGERKPDAAYWRDNMVQPVLFQEAVSSAVRDCGAFDFVVEVGPHPALKGPTNEILRSHDRNNNIPYSGVLDRKGPDGLAFSEFLGTMWTHMGTGAADVGAFVRSSPWPVLATSRVENAPLYPWDHSQIYYRESRIARQHHFRAQPPHELLGFRTRDDNQYELRWRNILTLESVPWIAHHRFQGQALLPASAYCIMALDAARALLGGKSASVIELEGLEFVSGIVLEPGSPGIEVLFSLAVDHGTKGSLQEPPPPIRGSFSVTSASIEEAAPMKLNFTGRLQIILGEPTPQVLPARERGQAETLGVSTNLFYDMMASIGLDYTGPFRGITAMERRLDYSAATLRERHADDTTRLGVSPATLDTCFQSAFTTLSSPGDNALWTSFLPRSIERVRFNLANCDSNAEDQNATLDVEAYLTKFKSTSRESAASFSGDISIFDASGQGKIQVEGLTVSSFGATKPEHDYELYLTTVMNIDPEDEIVSVQDYAELTLPTSPMLIESCERVAKFYLRETPIPQSPSLLGPMNKAGIVQGGQPKDTAHTINTLIESSPHTSTLKLIRTLGTILPDLLPGMLPVLIDEAHQLAQLHSHLSHITRQIAHRYPRMNVLGLADPELGIARALSSGLENSFVSLTTTSASEKAAADSLSMPKSRRTRILLKEEDLDWLSNENDSLEKRYDLVVASTSLIRKKGTRLTLKRLNLAMTPGGFFILIHRSTGSLKTRLRRCVENFASQHEDPVLTPPDWPDALSESGFSCAPGNSHQSLPSGHSLVIRQAESEHKQRALRPLANSTFKTKVAHHLLIVGGRQDETRLISSTVCERLSSRCADITVIQSLGDAEPGALASPTAVILLSDLDEPFLSGMTEGRLAKLKALLRPEIAILWVTRDALYNNPENAASFGFARTILAETPGLTLRMLDIEPSGTPSGFADIICDEFARLVLSSGIAAEAKAGNVLWSHEPEVHIRGGRRLVPRVVPWKEANNRLNSARRIVSEVVNTLDTPVELVASSPRHGLSRYEVIMAADPRFHGAPPDQSIMQIDYSSARPIGAGRGHSTYYVCVGHDVSSRALRVALSETNSSIIVVPTANTRQLMLSDNSLFLSFLLRSLAVLMIMEKARGRAILLVEPDEMIIAHIRQIPSASRIRFAVSSSNSRKSVRDADVVVLHQNSSRRQIKATFPPDVACIFDFSPPSSKLSRILLDALPEICEYHSSESLLSLGDNETGIDIENIWGPAIALALQQQEAHSEGFDLSDRDTIPVPDLLNNSAGPNSPFQLVDWRQERNVPHVIKPLVETHLLKPDKTYVLVGLTRDLGQSLSRLFVKHGARNIVLASRNPNKSPKWKDELVAQGVNMQIEVLDVTDLDDVFRFKERLATTTPPVAGVVNGAMILEDRVFSQMTVETFNRVMKPKTVGSKNLDLAFDSPELEFFIMTSSFAAIGGHAGQSNYAAANMYMNGLAASRRRRGLPGMALNIGVIYGLGLLHRERENLYGDLERDGYPPISERDIHHMFLEAIVAGRPTDASGSASISDITTGLSRYRVDDPSPLHWHRDPRFSHYTVEDEGNGEPRQKGVTEQKSVRDLMLAASSAPEAAGILATALARRLEALLRLPAESVSEESSASELGVDSLAAVEVRSWLWRTVEKDVGVMKILGAASIARLSAEIAESIVGGKEKDGNPA